jgi:Txe/YoeB family toxin of Txe-Axe toxin-antitoxin module
MEQEYHRQQSEFTNLHNQWDTNYQASLTEKEETYDRFLGQNQADFAEQLADQETEFQGLVKQFDEAFSHFDMDGAFNAKFEKLEEEYAEQYSETKRITHEIYTTTLTYRFVENEEEQE